MIENLTIGSDAEVIIGDLSNRPFPVCGIIGGTKEKPRRLGSSQYYVQEDNVLLEYNIPPCANASEFVTHMKEGLQRSLNELPPSLKLLRTSTAVFDRELIQFGQAYIFGCDPDYNAWTMEENPRPSAKNKELRSAAGHVHLGWDNPTNEDRIDIIKAADIFAGLRSVYFFRDRNRRELYGKAGSFRPKPYGVEHRVLDNEWVWGGHAKHIYLWYQDAVAFVNNGLMKKVTEELALQVQDAVNNYKESQAKSLVRYFEKEMEKAGIAHASLKM